ncbi:hypothetical protein AYK25_06105 [Thermoplasmatales archaeon SM1-50]|nr:MAG: hypothetical protein AYK25_06105 [Thermoplasmatales archaeon SM1-50]
MEIISLLGRQGEDRYMNKKTITLLIINIVVGNIFVTGCITNNEPAPSEQTDADIAVTFVSYFANDSFIIPYNTLFNDTLKTQTTPEQLQLIWNQIEATYGNFTEIISTRTTEEQGYSVVYVTCNYDKLGLLDTRVVFDDSQQITGFQFVPTDLSDEYKPPSYANTENFTEYNVTVGEGTDWPLPGTLTLPRGDGPFPAIVLVHGSGSSDRDETIGPNKPFKDLAWGLATRGIAVLRYEKRTKYYASTIVNMLANLTVYGETIDDARAAVTLLQTIDKINRNHIYVLGHSLGAMLAPRIAQNNSNITGLIMLAAPTRPLTDLLLNQTIYLALLDGNISEAEQAQIDSLRENISLITSHSLDPSEIILGASAAYWYDLNSYNPVETALALHIPMLILQGERDFQVSYTDDFLAWQQAFVGNTNVTLIAYPLLNHLFIAGNGPPTNTEYNQPGNVDEQVVIDITNWVGSFL